MGEGSDIFRGMVGAGLEFPQDEVEMKLQEVYKAFTEPSTFKPGQLIRARATAPTVLTLGTCIVLEARYDDPVLVTWGDPQDVFFNTPLDIYIGHICPAGHVHTHWAPSFFFERQFAIPIIGQKPAG